MGKIVELREAVRLIWETVKISKENNKNDLPYLFIVGAGISAPEIPSAKDIVQHCMDKVNDFYKDDQEGKKRIFDKVNLESENSAKYYSFWFEQAYKNKIHRQQYLKKIIKRARISTSNLLLAQILNNKEIATTVITPNFDNQLVKSLNLLGNYDVFSAVNELDNIAMEKNSEDIQIMHVHGTYRFYDCCNLECEIVRRANSEGIKSTVRTLEDFLKSQSPIVLGYSGWEDDVIMRSLKERLEISLPYSLIWFCYSHKDYDVLPVWLKDSEDVIFVVPSKKNSDKKAENNEDDMYLPAEDVLTALITKFKFGAPNLLRNPLQYYIELINGFLPENESIFPIKSWKRRLDYVEEHIGEVEKKIVELEDAAARKSIVDANTILQMIEHSFMSEGDLEHIFDGIIMPLINSKNRIEDEKDLFEFLYTIIDLISKRIFDIDSRKIIKYLKIIIEFINKHEKYISEENAIQLYDIIIAICKNQGNLDEIELVTLGIKSEIVDYKERLVIQENIIKRGKKDINNALIARLVLVATCKQIGETKTISTTQQEVFRNILDIHNKNVSILECYYYNMVEFYEDNIEIGARIEDIIQEIERNQVSKSLVLHAKRIQCEKIEDISDRIEVAKKTIDDIQIDKIDKCQECIDYAYLLEYVVLGKISLNETVEHRYISNSVKLCNNEERCALVCKIIVNIFYEYISYINSQFEKRDICKKAIMICNKSNLDEEWIYYCNLYMSLLEEDEKEDYLIENERYKMYKETYSIMCEAICCYEKKEKDICRELLLEASEKFDAVFDNRYNPALINICFMARRDEIPELEVSCLDIMKKIKWMGGNAFYHINKSLAYIKINEWGQVKKEIMRITNSVDEAVNWWSREEVVGNWEKNLVLFLLIIHNKVESTIIEEKIEVFMDACIKKFNLPQEYIDEINIFKTNIW